MLRFSQLSLRLVQLHLVGVSRVYSKVNVSSDRLVGELEHWVCSSPGRCVLFSLLMLQGKIES